MSTILLSRPSGRPGRRCRSAFSLAALALTSLTCVATAAVAAPSTAQYLAGYDGDGDGRVSLAEYQAYLSRGFERMDRNADGRVAGDEWPQPNRRVMRRSQHLANLAAMFRRQDRNGDGFLSLLELTAPPR